ncbi:SH3 domain-containing protein [Paradevosia shaoguanensis]|uniref:SH3 domain-containing protein n=1 Tax=Paradevosia shaoguanensis TaxID=1335043 RepID=UPI0019340DFE|nr:SH3 domain-containing protein [Paradevosia shaoguanensis]
MLTKKITIAAVAAVAVIGSTAAALAAPAVATSNVNLRNAPGGAKIGVLYAGEQVNVKTCQGSWCYVQRPGPDGWVSRNYLAIKQGNKQIPFNFGFTIGPDGPQVSVGVGNGPFPHPPAPSPKVCFFEHINYGGASFCENAGTSESVIDPAWNDRISSVKLSGGAKVTVCRDIMFGGGCSTWVSSKANVGGSWNDVISSYKVH